jgi:Secretion system C-terminal sorting domain/PKD domain
MEGLLLHSGRILSLRYCLLSIFLLLVSINSIQAKTVVIGGGSGYITVPDMTGLNPGDTLAITAGQYTGATFNNLNGITITNNGSAVVFNGKVMLNTLVGCVFAGFQFRNVNGTSIRWVGNSRRCTEKNISFMYCSGIANDANDVNIYNGDTSSLKLYMCTFDSLTLFSSGIVLRGAYGIASDQACYMDSIVLSRIKVDSTLGNGLEVGGVIFRIDVHDWKETYIGVITQGGDVGIIDIYGNGSLHNIYRTGGRGYIARIWDLGLKVPGNTYYYNNIDLNTTQYGSLDTKIDATQFSQYVTGANCFIFNNTVGNKEDHIGYWSSIAVVGDYPLPWVCQVKNNLGFNLQTNNKPPIAMNQSNGSWITDSSNNMYFATPDSVIDPVTCVPFPNSPVLGKGLTLNLVQDDYYHNPRIGAYDIGAVQHGGTIIPSPPNLPPVAVTGAEQTITLPATTVTLDGSNSYDPDGIISSYAWVLISGTGGTIVNPSSATTLVGGLTPGTYVYKLTVTDNSNASSSALDTIIVNPASSQPEPNVPPVANAGSNQTITAPASSVILNGSSSFDPDGTIVSYAWVMTSGQGSVILSNSNTVMASVTGLTPGTFTFQLTVTDNSGATNSDQVTVTVNPDVNKINLPPVAIAGSDTTIYLPVSSFLLNASNSYDPDGNIVSYQWLENSGPNTAVASSMNNPEVDLGNLQEGIYQFQLTVTDNEGASSTAVIKISVDKNSTPPDQFIVFPNPVQDILNGRINSSVNGTISMVVYDMNGRSVMADEAEKSADLYEKSLNVSALASGMYTIQVNISNMKFLVTKFIKK